MIAKSTMAAAMIELQLRKLVADDVSIGKKSSVVGADHNQLTLNSP